MLDLMAKRAENFVNQSVPPQENVWHWRLAGALVFALYAIAYAIADLADAMRKK